MTAAILTRESVVELTEKIVAEKGREYVYPRFEDEDDASATACHYVRDGAPSCLVGHLFAALGVPIERLEVFDTVVYTNAADNVLRALVTEGSLAVEADDRLYVEEFVRRAQMEQDSGETWGDALLIAKERASL